MVEEEYSDRVLGKEPLCFWVSMKNGIFRLGHEGDTEECLYYEGDPQVEEARNVCFMSQEGTVKYKVMKYFFSTAGGRFE